jgi:lambda repressor-like predicted transcriptional regulator
VSRRQTAQSLEADTVDQLRTGDPDARLNQMLVSAQNSVVIQREGYTRALMHRAECIALAHAAGWSKYRIAQQLGITRRAVDEALTRPKRTPAEFLAAQVRRNGGHENASDRNLRDRLLAAAAVPAQPADPHLQPVPEARP